MVPVPAIHVRHVIPDSLHRPITQVAQPVVQNHVQRHVPDRHARMETVRTVQMITRVRKTRPSLRVPLRHCHVLRQQIVVMPGII